MFFKIFKLFQNIYILFLFEICIDIFPASSFGSSHFGSSQSSGAVYQLLAADTMADAAQSPQLSTACALLQVLCIAGASRHVVAATTSALWRLVASQQQECEEPEVLQRLAAIEPQIVAMVKADQAGVQVRSAAGMISPDQNLRGNAAKHTFGLCKPFDELGPAELRGLQRAQKKPAEEKATAQKHYKNLEVEEYLKIGAIKSRADDLPGVMVAKIDERMQSSDDRMKDVQVSFTTELHGF